MADSQSAKDKVHRSTTEGSSKWWACRTPVSFALALAPASVVSLTAPGRTGRSYWVFVAVPSKSVLEGPSSIAISERAV